MTISRDSRGMSLSCLQNPPSFPKEPSSNAGLVDREDNTCTLCMLWSRCEFCVWKATQGKTRPVFLQ